MPGLGHAACAQQVLGAQHVGRGAPGYAAPGQKQRLVEVLAHLVQVMQDGYMIGDRCLRPALVAVAKGGAKPAAQAGGNGAPGPKAANDDFPGGAKPSD